MKLFHILFGFYMLLLSSFPCTDEKKGSCGQISISQTESHHEDETCSPLCICSCCGTFAVDFIADKPIVEQGSVLDTVFLFVEEHIKEISFSIWQPPKLT